MSSGYLKRTCVRVVLVAHLMQIFAPVEQASDEARDQSGHRKVQGRGISA
jgi:hypothetical protein